MFRIIRDFKPTWVIAENVRGLLTIESGMAFEQVCLDLESISYTVQAFVIPACAVNAPHRRDRVWIVAHSAGRRGVAGGEQQGIYPETHEWRETNQHQAHDTGIEFWNRKADRHAADAERPRLEGGNTEGARGTNGRITEHAIGNIWDNQGKPNWNANWLTVATSTCNGRVDDGLPVNLDGLKLSKSKHREERLKSLGNAIVPQVAIEIMRAIKATEVK